MIRNWPCGAIWRWAWSPSFPAVHWAGKGQEDLCLAQTLPAALHARAGTLGALPSSPWGRVSNPKSFKTCASPGRMSSLENCSDCVVPKSTAGEEQIVLEMSFCIYICMCWLCLQVHTSVYISTYKICTCILVITQNCVCYPLNNPRGCLTVITLVISQLMLLIKRVMIWGRKAAI